MNWIPSLKDVTLTKKRVLLRVDYNVPLEYVSINQKNVTRITDTSRIDATISTIQAILDKNPTRLIIVSHLGRPDGSPNLKYSLKPVALYLQEKLDRQVILFDGSSYSFPPESEGNL